MSIDLNALLNPVHDKKLVSGTVASCNADVAVLDLFSGGQGFLPVTNWYGGSSLPAIGSFVTAVTLDSSATPLLSAVDNDVLRLLVEGLCPEIYAGDIRVMEVARIPGVRAKVAVAATVEGIDAVRTVVGRAANRVATMSAALRDERIDIIAWSDKRDELLANAMAPAAALSVKISKNGEAKVTVDENKVAAAVGVHGTNAALAKAIVGLEQLSVVAAK